MLESDLCGSLEVADPKHSPFQCLVEKLLFFCDSNMLFLFLFSLFFSLILFF